jgi:hypothetical protein
MDPAILSAVSGLTGAVIGAVSSLATSWLSQRDQLRAQALRHEADKREALYAEFITEASKRYIDAWDHQAEGPEVIAGLHSALGRMRLSSSNEVIYAAGEVIRLVTEAYADANRTFDEARERVRVGPEADPLKDFAEACRVELQALRV